MKAAWGEVILKEGADWKGFDFCGHKIRLKRTGCVLSVIHDNGKGKNKAAPVGHYRINKDTEKFLFKPHLPDRDVVISHSDTVYILPGEELTAYCILPLSVALYEMPGQRLICEYPTRPLSKTLFGETDSGQILYSYPKSLALKSKELDVLPVEVFCPLKIKNDTAANLTIKRLCVRVKFLSVYKNKAELYTDMVFFNVKGQTTDSQILIKPYSPETGGAGEKITAAQVSSSSRLVQKSFDFFKAIGQL